MRCCSTRSYCQSAILPARVERRARAGHHRRAVRLPCVLVLAHPLHAHRLPGQRARQQRGVGGDVVGAVVAVAARAFDVDAAHPVGRHLQQLGQRSAQRIDALAVGPDRVAAAVLLRRPRRTGRSRRASGRAGGRSRRVGGLRRPPCCRAPSIDVVARRRRQQRLVDVRPVAAGWALPASARTAPAPAPRRWPGIRARAMTARKLPSRTTFSTPGMAAAAATSRPSSCACVARRTHDARMHHAGRPHVLHVGRAAGDLGGNVDAAPSACPMTLVQRRIAQRRRGGRRATCSVIAPHQLAVSDAAGRRR